jgi:hypothetical protein
VATVVAGFGHPARAVDLPLAEHGVPAASAVEPAADVPPPSVVDGGAVAVSFAAGYAFRATDVAVDDRANGAAASVTIDAGPRFHGFRARVDALALGFPAGDAVDRPLAVGAVGPALTYAFDDTDVLALAHAGALLAMVVDDDGVDPAFGVDVGLQLRFRAGSASHFDARVIIPVFLDEPRLALQAAALVGVGISPDRLVVGLARGETLASLLLPVR